MASRKGYALPAPVPFIRREWGLFLDPLVGKGKSVSVRELGEKLRPEGTESDVRGELYAYLRQKQTVYPRRAFSIGQALRECSPDCAWVNGALAFYAAGHVGPFVRLLAALEPRDDRLAVKLALLVPMLLAPPPMMFDVAAPTLKEFARDRLAELTDADVASLADAFEASDHGSNKMLLDLASAADRLSGNAKRTVIRAPLLEWALGLADDPELVRFVSDHEMERWRENSVSLQSAAELRSCGMLPRNLPSRAATKRRNLK